PGDRPSRQVFLVDDNLQEKINKYFGSSNAVRYMFSRFAKTNNGIYVLMDVKGHNKGRFEDLHGIVSEGMHKLDECIEEGVQSLFFVVTNPEDIQIGGKINKESKSLVVDESFSDRIGYIDASYLTGVEAEVRIWKNLFGNNISDTFLPGVLDNFARVIISSRLVTDSPALEAWLGKDFATKYSKYCDANGLLLKMEIYSGNLPKWLSEEDVKSFVKKHRKDLILKEGEKEGLTGISGRDSIRLFNSFYFSRKQKQFVTMAHVDRFFRDLFKNDPLYKDHVPKGFLDSLKNWYDYTVVQQLKESLYDYNEAQIKEDIIHYIFSLSHDVGEKVHCPYTGKEINITEDFLSITEDRIFGEALADEDREYFREDRMEEFTRVLAQEGLSLKIEETRMFEDLYESFVHRIKETVLIPFIKNNNFREAIKSYAEEDFKTFDSRIREKVTLLIKNLCGKFGYTEESAKEICVYVLDNKIADKFA
ncbi:MAG: serine protein kinase PrkA, partial [Candidatus Marinimicrobia bacterium]|nr:serine protein kinase PrkA [Candidatus Neomarinimicrobiota bacterium]